MITGNDLLQAGWPPGPHLAEMLKSVARMQERGIQDRDYMLKMLRREFAPPPPTYTLRQEPVYLAEAIEATNDADANNIAAVRRSMAGMLRIPVVTGAAIMPDACPVGNATASVPVGGVIAVRNAIIPAAHSADICCSMFATFYRTDANVETQLDALLASTRFGPGGREEHERIPHPIVNEPVWANPFLQGLQRFAAMHLADQGDGNHFAYLGRTEFSSAQLDFLRQNGKSELADALASPGEWKVLVTHHGSRGLGAHVYKRGQTAAEKHTKSVAKDIPETAAWLDYSSTEGESYWEALQYVSRWTRINHQCIHTAFLEKLKAPAAASFGNEHNFVWKRGDTFYHGKGATPAWKDEQGHGVLGLIPLHMAAPILIVLGADNAEFHGFAPHGAGRNTSRMAVLRSFQGKDGNIDHQAMKQAMTAATKDISVRWWHGKPDVSETPIGYKPPDQVKAQIKQFGLAHLVAEIQPLGSIMAGYAGPRPWERLQDLTPKEKRQIEHRADRRKSRQSLRQWEDAGEE